MSYGSDLCIDFLESDGWTFASAEAECAAFTDEPGTEVFVETTELGSCKNTVDPITYTKRCDACEFDWDDPIPRFCIGRNLYVYVQSFFPDDICADYMAGSIEDTPWPDYHCTPSSDVCADNGYECGPAYHPDCPNNTVDCGACSDPTTYCLDNQCEPISSTTCDFPDAQLEAVIRTELSQPTGDILAYNLLGIVALDASFQSIANITGMECLVNLVSLDLSHNQIVNISPIGGLTDLTSLNISDNQISNINAVSGVTALESFYSNDNQISDISPLSGLVNLTTIFLYNNQISDISSLSGLTSLGKLYVENNQISDISAVSNMTGLYDLRVDGNQISNISAVSGMTLLFTLSARSNQIADIGVVTGLDQLDYLYLQNNLISDISPIVNCAGIHNSTDVVNVTNNFLDCSDPTTQSNISTLEAQGVDLTYDCCEDLRTDGVVCSGVECGTVNDTCGVLRNCGACSDPSDICIDNVCEPEALNVYRCNAVYFGTDECIDFLEFEGWTLEDAQVQCAAFSDIPGTETVVETNEEGSCKNLNTGAFPRCIACEVDWGEPSPRSCIGRIYYMYYSDFFPEMLCVDDLAGTEEAAPWPSY
jgi:Leucine-rich repeat (LRR) protein